MNFSEYMYSYEIKRRQKQLTTIRSLDTGFDEKTLLKRIISGKQIYYFTKKFK